MSKVVLITGAGAGIGMAAARLLAAHGWYVVLSDIDLASVSALAAQIRADGGEAEALAQDVRSEAAWRQTIDDILQRLGALHGLVNNAGIATICGIEDETLDGWQKTQAVNSDAVFLGCREAIRAMKGEGGVIVNVSSIEGIVGDAMLPAYNASKGAVRSLTKSVALYCAANQYPIRVNSLHPGYVATPLVANALARLPAAEAESFTASVLAKIPLGRMAMPEEIAQGIRFLLGDESSYMTGAELILDGGYIAA